MALSQRTPLSLIYLGWLVGIFSADAPAPALVVYQPPYIEAQLGCPVSLSCAFNYTGVKDPIFAGKFCRGDSKEGETVHERCQPVGSSGRYFTSNLSLTIESPRPADEDVYHCEVLMISVDGTTIEKGSGTQLSLHAPPSSIEIQPSSPLVSGHTATLDCKVSGFYPRNPSVLWFHGGTPVLPSNIDNSITMNDDGTFSLHSRYELSPVVKDNSAECVCQASHPRWRQMKNASITLSVSYGPMAVKVTSDSEAVTNSSVRVIRGSTLNLMCSADGNPKPEIQWLGGSIKGAHHADTLHIPAVQREHEGVYWCAANNTYGEQNTSITLLVSYSDGNSGNADGHKALYGLGVIPVVLVSATIIAFLKKKGQKNESALAGQGPSSESQEPRDGVRTDALYAKPKRHWKKQKPQSADPSALDSSQLIYTDILFPVTPRNVIVTSDEPMTIYSEVGNGRGRDQDRRGRGQKQALDSVYV